MALSGNEPINSGHIKRMVDDKKLVTGNSVATDKDYSDYMVSVPFEVGEGDIGPMPAVFDCTLNRTDVRIKINASEGPAQYFEIGKADKDKSLFTVPAGYEPSEGADVGGIRVNYPNTTYERIFYKNGAFVVRPGYWDRYSSIRLAFYSDSDSYLDWKVAGDPLQKTGEKLVTLKQLRTALGQ